MVKTYKKRQTNLDIFETNIYLNGHIFAYGRIGCLDENTKIFVYENKKQKKVRLKDLSDNFNVISYNFDTNKREVSPAIKIDSGEKKCFEIELENGKKIYASKEHVFYDEKGDEIKVKDLKKGMSLFYKKNTPNLLVNSMSNIDYNVFVKEKNINEIIKN